jgi:phosphate starvation-inducible PhoH-like protein
LSTEAGERLEKSDENVWMNYPRPQMKRESWMPLNGTWKLDGGEIRVPFPPQSKLSGYEKKVKDTFTYEKKFTISEEKFERELFGNFDENIKLIEESLNIDVILREGNVVLLGEEKNVDKALKLMNELQLTVSNGKNLDKQSITYSLHLLLEGSEEKIKELEDTIVVTKKGNAVQPKTLGQKKYLDLIKSNDITFGIGPAGTGKTYLAVAMAVRAFKRDEVSRIILTRPAVEAGESLGFLPGDLKDKVDPYLRPLYDALFDMLGEEKFNKYLERGLIEVAPLAFMRGRTLDNAFIILDEAQNTTKEQMKMFLTRLGFGSKAVVTGDLTQIDLPKNSKSGLIHATEVLKDVEGIGTMFLTQRDVVRHELVQRIIIAYEKYDNKKEYNKLDKK